MVVSLHSTEGEPVVLQPSYEPMFLKHLVRQFSERLKNRFEKAGLPYGSVGEPEPEDLRFPPRRYFNLASALHHVSGAAAFVFECTHGSIGENNPLPAANHEQILDIQLNVYDEMLGFVLENRLIW